MSGWRTSNYIPQTELEQLLTLGKDAIAQGLLMLSDEPLVFIYLSAIVGWMRILPPPDLHELAGEISGEVLINLFLIWATTGMGVQTGPPRNAAGTHKSEGEIVWSAYYRAYGEIARLDVSQIDNPLRFQG